MFALGSLLLSIIQILSMILMVYQYVIIVAAIVSWVGADPYNPIVRILRQATEPVFYYFRKLLPRALFRTGIDFTPLIVLLVRNWGLGLAAIYAQKLAGPGP